uniref:Transmembrane protein 177 n=1 Tax=Graphocephala atropunctata TaxID=36148 RepID=A0A1B6LVG2_9HEMI
MSRPLFVKPSLLQRGILSAAVLYGSSFLGVSYYAKHTFLLDYYKKYIELQGKDGPIKPSEKLQSMFIDVSKEAKEFVSDLSVITPFVVPGLRIVHGGTYGTFQGGVVGLPAYFEFNTKEDVKSNVMVDGAQDFEEDELCNLFLLSDEAKKYVIAREILLINTMQVYFKTGLPILVAYSIEMISKMISGHLKLANYPVPVRAAFYVVVITVGLLVWNFLNTALKQYYEAGAESIICKLGISYLNGGIEFYSKELKRNQLQVELKNQTSSMLKTIDNFMFSILSFNEIPVLRRIAYLKAHLELESKKYVTE